LKEEEEEEEEEEENFKEKKNQPVLRQLHHQVCNPLTVLNLQKRMKAIINDCLDE